MRIAIVISIISSNEALRGVIRVVLYLLMGAFHLSFAVFSCFSFSSELGIVMAGLVASSLIAAVYVVPWVLLFSLASAFPIIKP